MKRILLGLTLFIVALMSSHSSWATSPAVTTEASAPAVIALEGVINMNSATATELQLLPGVGEARAQAIIEARQTKPFAGDADLLAVKGVGEKAMEKWKPFLRYDGATTLKKTR
jgi:competence protein ComEA